MREFKAARAAALGKALAVLGAAVNGKEDSQVKQSSDDASTALNAVLGRG